MAVVPTAMAAAVVAMSTNFLSILSPVVPGPDVSVGFDLGFRGLKFASITPRRRLAPNPSL
jgi:hypothetical protein